MELTLKALGYNDKFEHFRKTKNLDSFEVGRVISEHKERYIVKTVNSEYEAEITGQLRYTANQRIDFPAVGDWVAISTYDEDKAIIHVVFSRNTIIERQAVGKHGEKQIIATNIDFAFIVQSVDRDFNLNRIERYLTICYTSNVTPIIVLSKIDLIEENKLLEIISLTKERIQQVPVIPYSDMNQRGYDELIKHIEKGKTYCLLGSSGVGKSTLVNKLSGKQLMKTKAISLSSNRGKHVTSHRELILMKNGGILIDTPGMREIGIADSSKGLEVTFDTIHELAKACRFNDCTHTSEAGCAVLKAVEEGTIDKPSYENYLKMEKEKEHFESTVAEKRKKDKDFGKMIKNYKKKHKK